MKKNNVKIILSYMGILLLLVLAFSTSWGINHFEIQSFDQLIFHSKVSLEGTNSEVYVSWCLKALLPSILITAGIFLLNFLLSRKKKATEYKFYNKTVKRVCSIIMAIVLVGYISFSLDIPSYVYAQTHTSEIFEDYYVDPSLQDYQFPNEKRNLIYIYVESMEPTFSTKNMIEVKDEYGNVVEEIMGGGFNETNYIPNLSNLAIENTNFSHSEGIGGAFQATNVGWTVGGIVGQTSGVPISIPIDGNSYTGNVEFLPGAYSLGQVLEKEGYNQMFMMGSSGSFAGRNIYLEQHGNYEIFDLETAYDKELLPRGYQEWWGFTDELLFTYAKTEITEMATEEAPFNFSLLTTNTHSEDGYIDDTCNVQTGDGAYVDAVICNDAQISSFIEWSKTQDWYEDTTIVIAGDHLSMNKSYMNAVNESSYYRTMFNTFINPVVETNNTKNRDFSGMDMYPTTLASLGVTWDSDRLGLGTNLFSSTKTIPEEIGVSTFNEELLKRSKFYNNRILYATKNEE